MKSCDASSVPPPHPNLAPSNFWLSPRLKKALKSQQFSSDNEIQATVWSLIRNNQENLFMDRI